VITLRLISLLGILTFLGLAWAMSTHRRNIPWRVVGWGMGLQLIIALLVFQTQLGQGLFEAANVAVTKLNEFANEGSKLVFGPLAERENMENVFGPGKGVLFVIAIPATIIFVSALSSLLYHWRVLPWIVTGIAWVMRRTLRTSGSETLASAANVFMGQTEAPLVIQPYLKGMTKSELMTMMVGGMATIAGGVFAVYHGMGVEAGHLLTASFMAAPTALYMSKILLPETDKSETADGAHDDVKAETTNALDAMCQGASDGMKLTINVLAMLIGFTAVIALFNYLLVLPQSWAGVGSPVSFDQILGWLNAPFAWLMGVPWSDCPEIGQAFGKRMVFTEFIGYMEITNAKETLDPRSFTLATFAICGFANFASIAIQIGGIGSLAPERRKDLASLGLRAMAGGILVGYTNACIAGLFI